MGNSEKAYALFADLTWDDLRKWSGSKILARGKSYQKQGLVSDLVVTNQSKILASVLGRRQYETMVEMDQSGKLFSQCTCPYRIDCKHGIAVILQFFSFMDNDHIIPSMKQGDHRMSILGGQPVESKELPSGFDTDKEIKKYLLGKTKIQLLEILDEMMSQNLSFRRKLADRVLTESGHSAALVERTRIEIRNATSEPIWSDTWGNGGNDPDYSKVDDLLNALAKTDNHENIVALGWEMLESSHTQWESSNDEGEISCALSSIISILIESLGKSSHQPHENILKVIDTMLADQGCIFDELDGFLKQPHQPSDWGKVADILLQRLSDSRPTSEMGDFHSYTRDHISEYASMALEKANRPDDIIDLYLTEAPITNSYSRLVDLLILKKRYNEAEKWIRKGLLSSAGSDQQLRRQYGKVLLRNKNKEAYGALIVEDFVHSASLTAYLECQKSCKKVSHWPKVRVTLLTFLENRMLPWDQTEWPLPSSGLRLPKKPGKTRYPNVHLLIQIAIHEKDPQQVLYWYDKLEASRSRYGFFGADKASVASAVKSFAPERSITIWKGLIEDLIAEVKPQAYEEALVFLKQADKVSRKEGLSSDWANYVQMLREEHKRKTRLMEVLDRLEGKKSRVSKIRR